jgi:predicted secreted acid phosphatase
MKKIIIALILFLIFPFLVFAKEPANLTILKKEVINYYESKEYDQDVQKVVDRAKKDIDEFLQKHKDSNQRFAAVFDIDDTSLVTFDGAKTRDFGAFLDKIKAEEIRAKLPANKPVLELYNYLLAKNIKIFFITGRANSLRAPTIRNLTRQGYANWAGILMRPDNYDRQKYPTSSAFKSAARENLTKLGYQIIIDIGDQESDLSGGFADHTYKLPNPMYFLP